MKKIIVLLIVVLPYIANAQKMFTTPATSFLKTSGETVTDLSFLNESVENIQTALTARRALYSTDIIRITLSGRLVITDAPLTLSDNMVLVLNGATIEAASNASASALIAATNAHFVSITALNNGGLDGKGKSVKAIALSNCGKTHVDSLTIKNCAGGAIDYSGYGLDVYADAGSVTRTNIENCGSVGIQFNNVFHFVCTDNQIKSCTTGISYNGNNALVSNNTITGCTTGIASAAQYDAITYNTISTATTAVQLSSTSTETVVAYNSIKNNATGFNLAGTSSRVYYNDCDNSTEVVGSGSSNHLYANKGIAATEGNATGCTYFNPPLIGNQHTDLVKLNKTRYDITITSAALNTVRATIDAAHTAQPNAVVVVHLNGTFTTSGTSDSLLVKENECILLAGTINGSGSAGTVVHFKDNSTVSFSGGTINGNGTNGTNALVYITGSASVVLDSVSVLNGAKEGITKRNSFIPTYIRACTVDNSNGSGIWQLAASRLMAFQNTSQNSGMDGFDLDAYTSTSVLMKNTGSTNSRYGVFIEEGASQHLVAANTLTANQRGVSLYNLSVANANTAKNLVALNACRFNQRGIHIDAISADRARMCNVFFNNACENNTDVGLGGLYNVTRTKNNYLPLQLN